MFKLSLRAAYVALALCVLAPVTPAPTQAQGMQTQHVTENIGNVMIDWTEGVIKVTGVGSPPDRGTLAQKQLMAERSASSDAYHQLAEVLYGLRVNSETLVRDYVVESDKIKSYVSALIKGATKLDQRYLDDGSIEVDLGLELYGSSGLSGILQPQKQVIPPPPVDEEADSNPGEYTGIIVDVRGLGLEPAMRPAIVSQGGGEVYLGQLPIANDFVVAHGIVGYAHSLNQARQSSRVGDKPLIIKGLNATGNFRTNVVISKPDTRQLLGLEKKSQLLQRSKVIFVM